RVPDAHAPLPLPRVEPHHSTAAAAQPPTTPQNPAVKRASSRKSRPAHGCPRSGRAHPGALLCPRRPRPGSGRSPRDPTRSCSSRACFHGRSSVKEHGKARQRFAWGRRRPRAVDELGAREDSGSMGRALGSVLVGLLVVVLGGAGPAHSTPRQVQKSCPRGSAAGVIGGASKCLRSGQKCRRALDRQYHRYGFHCHTGRLAKAAKPKPPTVFSRRIDGRGDRVAIRCRGSAAPTVILESGFGSRGSTWAQTQAKLAANARVCYYDRAGIGDSDPRRPAGPVTAAKIVDELHTLLGRAGISAPYVL